MHLQGIRIWHKLLILGLITLLLCAVPTILFVQSAYKDIRSGQLEIAGLAPTEALVRVIQPIQVHRGLAAAVLTGNQVLDNARVAKAKEVSEAIAQAQATVPAHATPVVEALRVVAEEWKFLAAALSDKNLPMEENYNRHSKVTGAALKALDSCIDHFGLSLDPDPESSFPIIEAYQNLPRLAESIARLRAIGVSILSIKQATAEERVSITALVERLREEMEQSNEMLKKAAGVNNARQKIEAAATAVMNDTQKLVNVTDLEFVRIEILRYDAADYLKLATTALDAQYNLIRLLHGEIQQTISDRTAEDTRTMWLLLMLVAALLAVGVAATYWIARSITRPLNAAVNDANAIAAGDLGNDIAAAGTDEVGQVRQSMRHMQHNLGQIVSHIRQSSDALGNAALEIAQSTQNMSARAEEQASSLEQTAASMEELNSSFHKNDESSRHVSDLAAQAAAAAEQGGVVVGKVTGTMQEIDTASKKISEIIGVIDGIAFQTNILALNAAVEAARAGEQGRGFAVVATEVRALAQRSADAAKEIRTLIGDSVKKVQAGTRESAESRKAMDGILAAVRKVASTMTEMHTVREDQRRGVSQVTVAIEQMNQGTQQTAAMVEEIAATADMLSQQAQELTRAVATFKLRQQQGSGAAAATQRDLSLPHASTNTGVCNDFGLTDDEIADEIAGNWRAGKQPLLPSAER